jgi:hypothetical protein
MKHPVVAIVAMLALAIAGCAPKLSPVEEAIVPVFKGDYETAIVRLRPLAEAGDRDAQAFLGEAYYVRQDHAKSAKWLRISARRGQASAQYYLGFMFRDGLGGVPKDKVHAYKWFILSSKSASRESWPKPKDTWDPLARMHRKRMNEKMRRSFQAKVNVARNALAAELSAAQRADAERLARAWKPTP